MRPIITDVAWSVCLLVTTMSCSKSTEPTESPFGAWTWVGPRNHVLGGVPVTPQETGSFGEACPWPLWSIGNIWHERNFSVDSSSDADFHCQFCSSLAVFSALILLIRRRHPAVHTLHFLLISIDFLGKKLGGAPANFGNSGKWSLIGLHIFTECEYGYAMGVECVAVCVCLCVCSVWFVTEHLNWLNSFYACTAHPVGRWQRHYVLDLSVCLCVHMCACPGGDVLQPACPWLVWSESNHRGLLLCVGLGLDLTHKRAACSWRWGVGFKNFSWLLLFIVLLCRHSRPWQQLLSLCMSCCACRCLFIGCICCI